MKPSHRASRIHATPMAVAASARVLRRAVPASGTVSFMAARRAAQAAIP